MEKKPALFSTVPIIRHSFATPLTNILLNTEIAVKNLAQTPTHTEIYLQRVLLNAQYLQSALRLSDSAEHQPFSPQQALAELLSLNQHTRLKQHLVSRIFLPASLKLAGNRLAFQEMVACLLNNAYESYLSSKNRLVFLNAIADEQALVVSVADGGRGMPWLKQKLSTSPFYSTKTNHSGLGLYFVKRTIEAEFAGHFSLRSKLNKGTTVGLRFPLERRQAVAKSSAGLQY